MTDTKKTAVKKTVTKKVTKGGLSDIMKAHPLTKFFYVNKEDEKQFFPDEGRAKKNFKGGYTKETNPFYKPEEVKK